MKKQNDLLRRYLEIRHKTVEISRELEVEDFIIQAADFVSPTKWHHAHVTWFFEEFVLSINSDYKRFNPNYSEIFNSYYNSIGSFWNQQKRGILSRPTVKEIFHYRDFVDLNIKQLFEKEIDAKILKIIEIGIHHEEQHQELLQMDIKFNLFQNPLKPILKNSIVESNISKLDKTFTNYDQANSFRMGINYGDLFCYDNETPEYEEVVRPYCISNELVTNRDYKEFIDSGAISNFEFWYSDGFKLYSEGKQGIPLYWYKDNGEWFEYHIDGTKRLELEAPVKHLSFYEASAFASWKGCRLPTEAEWEFHAKKSDDKELLNQLWQWTSSPYQAHPGYKKPEGAIGEYNQKFMLNQIVLKGGCYFTPKGHHRISYRNFFYPDQKWMLSGLRLAKDFL
jgi:ergothioneine biosynthesis protein EgtB